MTTLISQQAIQLHLNKKLSYIPNESNPLEFPENIPLGKTRIGGHCLDIPPDFEYPGDCFMGQLNFKELSALDAEGILPKSGFLYLFIDILHRGGKALYFDCAASDLERVSIYNEEHTFLWQNGTFEMGMLIDKCTNKDETLNDYYNTEDAAEELSEEFSWNNQAALEYTKVLGLYNNPSLSPDELMKIWSSNKIVLLQIGEDYSPNGIFNVLIDKEDLLNLNFNKVEIQWAGLIQEEE